MYQYYVQYVRTVRITVTRKLTTLDIREFISVFNQIDAQNLFHSKFYFMPLHVSSTRAHHQEVKIALHSLWYHHTCTRRPSIGVMIPEAV